MVGQIVYCVLDSTYVKVSFVWGLYLQWKVILIVDSS